MALPRTIGNSVGFWPGWLITALAAGFAEELNLTLDEMPLTDREQVLVDELRAEQYANDKWINRV